MRIAIEGCSHGELDNIYQSIEYINATQGKKVDLLIICGDFEYRHITSYVKYYAGLKTPPCPTIFVGGNHEASNHDWELYHGGWVAKDIYYLGKAGVVWFGGLRIGGVSGTHKGYDYQKGYYEFPPYCDEFVKAFYCNHFSSISAPLDIFISHDWPRNIAMHGNKQELLQKKGGLRKEINQGMLGSPPMEKLMSNLQPRYWFSAHHHVKFPALVNHNQASLKSNPASQRAQPVDHLDTMPPPLEGNTKFLALDKCLRGRDFLQVLDIPFANGPKKLSYDPQWLAIVKRNHHLIPIGRQRTSFFQTPRQSETTADDTWVKENVAAHGKLIIPENFAITAPSHPNDAVTTEMQTNPQTLEFLHLLNLDPMNDPSTNPLILNPVVEASDNTMDNETTPQLGTAPDPREISLDDIEDDEAPVSDTQPSAGKAVTCDIDLDDDDECCVSERKVEPTCDIDLDLEDDNEPETETAKPQAVTRDINLDFQTAPVIHSALSGNKLVLPKPKNSLKLNLPPPKNQTPECDLGGAFVLQPARIKDHGL